MSNDLKAVVLGDLNVDGEIIAVDNISNVKFYSCDTLMYLFIVSGVRKILLYWVDRQYLQADPAAKLAKLVTEVDEEYCTETPDGILGIRNAIAERFNIQTKETE